MVRFTPGTLDALTRSSQAPGPDATSLLAERAVLALRFKDEGRNGWGGIEDGAVTGAGGGW